MVTVTVISGAAAAGVTVTSGRAKLPQCDDGHAGSRVTPGPPGPTVAPWLIMIKFKFSDVTDSARSRARRAALRLGRRSWPRAHSEVCTPGNVSCRRDRVIWPRRRRCGCASGIRCRDRRRATAGQSVAQAVRTVTFPTSGTGRLSSALAA